MQGKYYWLVENNNKVPFIHLLIALFLPDILVHTRRAGARHMRTRHLSPRAYARHMRTRHLSPRVTNALGATKALGAHPGGGLNELMNFNEKSEIKNAVHTRLEMERRMGGTGEQQLLNCY